MRRIFDVHVEALCIWIGNSNSSIVLCLLLKKGYDITRLLNTLPKRTHQISCAILCVFLEHTLT